MKKTKNFFATLRELDPEELSIINGGHFAYDLGTFLRFVGIYYQYGTGTTGAVGLFHPYVTPDGSACRY